MKKQIICCYSRTITGWLITKFPGAVSLDSSGAGNDEIIPVFQLLLPPVEFQATTQGYFNLAGRIKQLSGLNSRKAQLLWLLDLFEQSPLAEPLKDELYGQLKVFVKWEADPVHIAHTCLHLPVARQWVPGRSIRSVKAHRIIREKIGPPLRLTPEERSYLLDAMRISLAMNYRETDPVTFADTEELELFEMGRGLRIAIVGMQKQKRLSLESYVGYMAFRNGVPIAYGGGWIWGHRCRVGISIYPEFRKVESSWVFGQVLRLYHQYFRARHFIIRANQFGKGNHDGLRSGAFWFYYKLGFRPRNPALRKLARGEWKKIRTDRNYRSSLKTLRTFLTDPLEWNPVPVDYPQPESEMISRKISDMINAEYGGSRKKGLRAAHALITRYLGPVTGRKQLKSDAPGLENWGLLLNLLPEFRDWTTKNKKGLIELIRLKLAGKEREHILGMQNLRVFWKSLQSIETTGPH